MIPLRRLFLIISLVTTVLAFGYQFYFANLHAHTSYSDGTGTPEEAFEHAKNYVHVQAITDHAEYFMQKLDGKDKLTLTKDAALRATKAGRFLALWGFEWTGGVGHINVYCTDNWIDRTYSLHELYEWIVEKKALAQFNHPIATFGTFYDFDYDPKADEHINLFEVGNGSWRGRTISDEMLSNYILALKKGWHVGATAGQDNHRGSWGSANDTRTVILANGLTLESILEALRERRTYATEDRNAKLWFVCDSFPMGSIVKVKDHCVFTIRYEDDEPLEKLYLISESGTATEWTVRENRFETNIDVIPPDINEWYFIFAVQEDGDRIVSSPIWLRKLNVYPLNVRVMSRPKVLNLSFDLVNMSDEATEVEVKITVADKAENFTVKLEPKSKSNFNKIFSDLTPGFVDVRIELAGSTGWKGAAQILGETVLLDISHDNDDPEIIRWFSEISRVIGIRIELNNRYFKKPPAHEIVILPMPKRTSFAESRRLNDFEIESFKQHLASGGKIAMVTFAECMLEGSFAQLLKTIDPRLDLVEINGSIFISVDGQLFERYNLNGLLFMRINSLEDVKSLLEEMLK